MNWVDVIYGMMAGACAWLAGTNALVWLRDRRAWAQLAFSVSALAVIGVAACELAMMHTRSPEEYGRLFRWLHLAAYFAMTGLIAFAHFYLGTGRRWLALSLVLFCTALLVPNFTVGDNNSFRQVHQLAQVPAFGSKVSAVWRATQSPCSALVELSQIGWLAYVLDAAVKLWKRGGRDDRRRAVLVGGSMALVIILAGVAPTLFYLAGVRAPLTITLSFTSLMLALGSELSVEADRAARAARRLPASEQALLESEKRLELVLGAAELAAWDWDVKRDGVWMAPKGRTLLGFAPDEAISGARFFENVHPEDRSAVSAGVKRILEEGGSYTREYRRVLPDGRTRWIAGRGSAELDAAGKVVRVRGISVDVTARVEDAEALAAQQREVAALSRMVMHGELSGSLAHELNQPLTSILSNAQAAQRMMTKDPIDAPAIREILEDIVAANHHAADIVRRVRALVKNDAEVRLPVDVNEIARDTLRLMQSDLLAQGVEVETQFGEALPPILGDRVQIQQVLLNLVVNACDAMSARPPGSRRIVIRTEALKGSTLGVSVEDSGSGIPPELVGKVFEAFRTTKTKGLGLGLSVCRTIITAHGGALWATNNLERGSTFRFTMPTGDTHP